MTLTLGSFFLLFIVTFIILLGAYGIITAGMSARASEGVTFERTSVKNGRAGNDNMQDTYWG